MINHTGTEKGPGFISQQWGILDNELTFDPAILHKLKTALVEIFYL